MNKVLLQAELLGEAILESDEYIAMRLAEQAVIDNDEAQELVQIYSERKDAFQAELAKKPLDQEAVATAGSAVKETEKQLTGNELINNILTKKNEYSGLMQEVNSVISRVVNGESEGGCSGSCEGCGASCAR
ncbi:MAG: YlbF family regulator [Clostridiales bacterium]|nr:YlbF family regulator [Clostridiales bacterium]